MYALFEIVELAEGYAGEPQDRVRTVQVGGTALVIVADGAGGTGGGAAAAEFVVAHLSSVMPAPSDIVSPETWRKALSEINRVLANESIGQSTAVVAVMSASRACGASVGDSAAWLVAWSGCTILTEKQRRKPLLGDGAIPVVFERHHQNETLLVATDGLFKYAPPARICELARLDDLRQAASALLDAVRLPSGALQDDVGLVLCRPGLPIRAHKHSSRHRDEILRSDACGCFYCSETFPPAAIRAWLNERDGAQTAQCPMCGIDSVIGSASGYPMTPEFLEAMHKVWF